MPIYEYQCAKCGTFELMRRITEEPLRRCPTCKGKVERIVSRTSFVLKGSGWYATDYGRSGSSPRSESESKPESKPESGAAANGASASSSSSSAESSTKISAGAEKSTTSKSTD
jgi:putative FmdB family regulatory protein